MLSSAPTPVSGRQWTTGNVGKSSVQPSPPTPPSNSSAAMRGRRTRPAATSVGSSGSSRSASPRLTTSTRCWHQTRLRGLQARCGTTSTSWSRILSAGVNVVASASFVTGHNLGGVASASSGVRDRRFDDVRLRREPGFAELLAIVATTACDRVDKVTIAESADTTCTTPRHREAVRLRHADRRSEAAGNGGPGNRHLRRGRAVGGRLARGGTRRGRVRGRVRADHRGSGWRPGRFPAGCVAGVYASWQGRVGEDGHRPERALAQGQTLDPDWKLDGDGWKITIDGRPTVTMNIGFLPPPDLIENATSIEDFFVLRAHHDRDAADPRHTARRRRCAGDRDLQRSAAAECARG